MITFFRSMHRPHFFVPPSIPGAPGTIAATPRSSRFAAMLHAVAHFLSGSRNDHEAAAGVFLSVRRWSDQTERALHQALEHQSGCRFPW